MLKGCQREMIMLQTKDSALFESAWFVLRREKCEVGADDMMAEANRIIGMSGARRGQGSGRAGKLLGFLLGFLTGGGIFSLIWLLLR